MYICPLRIPESKPAPSTLKVFNKNQKILSKSQGLIQVTSEHHSRWEAGIGVCDRQEVERWTLPF